VSGHNAPGQGERWRVYPAAWARWLLILTFSVCGLAIASGVRIAQDGTTVVVLLLMVAGCGWGAWRSATISVSDDGASLIIREWHRTRRLPWDQILELTDGMGASGAWVITVRTKAGAQVRIRISQHVQVARLILERAVMHAIPVYFSEDARPRSPLGTTPPRPDPA
jgi:hypothetical protein